MIEDRVDRILESLYIPTVTEDGRMIFARDPVRCKHFGVEDEAINWGDLKCCEVRAFADGSYRVVIDEAAPNECPTLCYYVKRMMEPFGWKVEIETEW